MKTFHHGGRIGDLVFALWTMKELGGGKLVVSDFHHPNWSLKIAESMRKFLEMQPYVRELEIVPASEVRDIDYDLREAEDDYNPKMFPEWHPSSGWPGDANILKRYAVHFGLDPFERQPWLSSPGTKNVDVAFHVPVRRSIRSREAWLGILTRLKIEGLKVKVLGLEDIFAEPCPLEETADWINSSRVFLGTVSSCNAIAEGLGRPTIVEQANGCFNISPTVCINLMSEQEVVKAVLSRSAS